MTHYQCPGCKMILRASDRDTGSETACPHCGQQLRIPAPSTSIRTTPASPDPRDAITAAEGGEIRHDDIPRRRRRSDDEEDYDSERERSPRRNEPSLQPTDFLIPTNVSGWSLAACYLGLIGLCLPIAGLIFAIPALVCGIVALLRRRKTVSYGSVTSDVRAILGLIFSSLAILLWATILILIAVS